MRILKIIMIIILVLGTLFSITSYLNKATSVTDTKNTITDIKTNITNSQKIFPSPSKKVSKTGTRNIKVPVLMYHSVTDKVWGYTNLHVSPEEFDAQMKYLKDNNYTSLNFSELESASEYENPILITLDDGYENNYKEAYPILKKYNIKATIFMCSGFVGNKISLKEEQIKQMGNLVDIQSHTVTHPDLTKIDNKSLEKELKESKEKLEKITNKRVYAFAYPAGQYNNRVIEITKKYYDYAVLDRPYGFYYTGNDNYTIKRKYISRTTLISDFVNIITN